MKMMYPQGIHREVGIEVSPQQYGPVSLRPGGMNPRFNVFASAHGRQLAGLGGIDNMNAEGIENYPNELDLLAAADDVTGNGVFDPNLTHGNVHTDEGVFADHQSLPGYIERTKFYSPSEVTDLTTGLPVNYVPGGAVSFQAGQPEAYHAMLELYATPPNSNWRPSVVDGGGQWIPDEPKWGVSGLGVDSSSTIMGVDKTVAMWGTVGLFAGLGLAYYMSKKGR
jgi:hypothetical protein